MDNMNKLFELTFSHGGPGEVKAELDESPSTQAYYQAAAQNLPDYAQALADIHRQGDLDREAFNLIMPFYNNGLNNLYKEKLKEKEFQNDLAKTQLTYDLADRNQKNNLNLQDQLNWKKYLWDRQNALADRSHTELREDQLYDRDLALANKERDLAAKKLLEGEDNYFYYTGLGKNNDFSGVDLAKDKSFTGSKDFEPTINFIENEELENIYKTIMNDYRKLPNSIHQPNNDEIIKLMQDYIKNNTNYSNIEHNRKLLDELKRIYAQYYNNFLINKRKDITYNDMDKNIDDNQLIDYLGYRDKDGLLSGLSDAFVGPEIKQAIKYSGNDAVLLDNNTLKNNRFVNSLYNQINQLDSAQLENFGFTNTNGMEDKLILGSKSRGELYVYEKGSNNILRFKPLYDPNTRSINFNYLGSINYNTLDPLKNNYLQKGLFGRGIDAYNRGAYDLGYNIGEKVKNPSVLYNNFREKPAYVTKSGKVVYYKDLPNEFIEKSDNILTKLPYYPEYRDTIGELLFKTISGDK